MKNIKVMNRYWIIVVAILSNSGCSVAPTVAQPFSEDLLGVPDHYTAIVVVYRDYVPPLAYDIRIHINGRLITQIPNEGFTWARIPAGTTKIELKWPFIAATPGAEANFQAEAGKTYFVEATGGISGFIPNAYGGTALMSSSATSQTYDEAVSHLRECCRYIPGRVNLTEQE